MLMDAAHARCGPTSRPTGFAAFVRHAGFNVDTPDAIALEVLRRVLSYVTKTSFTTSAVRKRIAADDKRVAAEAKRDAEDERIATGGKL